MDYIAKENSVSTGAPLNQKAFSVYDVQIMKDINDKDVQIPVQIGIHSKEFIQDQINALTFQAGEWQKKLDAIKLLPTEEPK
jgi:hypothetical protein